MADRKVLRKLEGGDKWQEQFELYLKSLNCPYIGNHAQALSWLLGTALQVEEQGGINQKNLQQQDALKNIDGKKKRKNIHKKSSYLVIELFFFFSVQSSEYSCQVDKICETRRNEKMSVTKIHVRVYI